MPLAGDAVEKVTDSAESTELEVSPDGSRLAWQVMSGNRPALRVRDLARRTERVLPVPGPLSGANVISLAEWTWSPTAANSPCASSQDLGRVLGAEDRRRGHGEVAAQVQLRRAGRPDRMLRRDGLAGGLPAHRGRPDGHGGGAVQAYRLAYVDPATGAMTRGTVLARGDPDLRPVAGLRPDRQVVRPLRPAGHSQREHVVVPGGRAGRGDANRDRRPGAGQRGRGLRRRRLVGTAAARWGPGRPVQPTEESEGESTRRLVMPLTQ